jgi:hypothetical protein
VDIRDRSDVHAIQLLGHMALPRLVSHPMHIIAKCHRHSQPWSSYNSQLFQFTDEVTSQIPLLLSNTSCLLELVHLEIFRSLQRI